MIDIAICDDEKVIRERITVKKEDLFTDMIIRKLELSGRSGVSGVIKHLKDFMT